jgi:cytochrome c biogenesis protein CcdA
VCGKGKGEFISIHEKKIVSTKGLPCGCCQGYGDVESRVWHLQSTIGPILGLLIVMLVLGIVAIIATASPTQHAQILTLLGTLAGSVVGFYFRGQHTLPKAPQTRAPKLTPPNSPRP